MITRTGYRKRVWYCWAVSILLAAGAAAQPAMDRDAYLARIAELQQTGPEIARTQGKEALIAQYRALIDQNPGYANNIQLEAQIGLVYESDLSDSGQPPNMEAAYDQYLATMESYDPSHPYMKQVRTMAAERAVSLDPPAAEELYWGMIEDYPDDPTVVLSSYFNLAKLAEQNGDPAAAREYYNEMMNRVPADDTLSEGERLVVRQYEANAVLNLVAEAIRQADTPEERLAALQEFIDRYPDLPFTHGELIDELLQSVETMGERSDSQSDLQEAVQSLVKLLRERRDEELSMSPEMREARREQRRLAALGAGSEGGTGTNGQATDPAHQAGNGNRTQQGGSGGSTADDGQSTPAQRRGLTESATPSAGTPWFVFAVVAGFILFAAFMLVKKLR